MQELVDKTALAERFGKAASTYDQFAALQKDVGFTLLEMIPEKNFNVGLDLGCGSGFFLPNLTEYCQRLIAFDLSMGMLQHAKQKSLAINYLCGDAECLPLASQSCDLIYSSLAIQWCHDLQQTFREIKRVLSSQGYALFATLTDGSLSELKHSWAEIDAHAHVNQFHSLQQIEDYLQTSGWHHFRLEQKTHTIGYETVNEVLHSLKGIGASQVNGARKQGLLTKTQFHVLSQQYEQFRQPNGLLPVTYNVCYGVLHR